MGRGKIAITLTLLSLLTVARVGAADDATPTKQSGLETTWADLASLDDAKSSRALLTFAAKPKESVAFLKDHLKPVKADTEAFKKLVEQLDDKKFQVRDAASKQLAAEVEYLGKYAKSVIEECLKGTISAEQKKRLEELLVIVPVDPKDQPKAKPFQLKGNRISMSSTNGVITIMVDGKPLDFDAIAKNVPPPPGPNTQWQRAVRAVSLLETIGSPEAKAILKSVAGGEEEAVPTKEARAALERLEKSK